MQLNFEAVRHQIELQGRTQKWVAAQLDVTDSALCRYLNGERQCPPEVFAGLVRLLGVHPTQFIGHPDPEQAIIDAARAFGMGPDRFEAVA